MNHKALYRKFRPQVFEEVIGQEHLTATLRNQIVTENVAHAYLFSGIRGTGKTSTAKIFARALNCTDSKDGNPCNQCDNCLAALSDNAIDIIEIDAASNNGVDDIRDLREKTKYPPSKMKYKVYIIDEVHMLSIGAFNALLKTLEEPPSYVIFIFATTELHKIPATIISRCQKYELKRIKLADISALMSKICDASDFTYDLQALNQIARLSEGAARDSLSILDQCFAANKNQHITLEVLTDVLGLVTESVLFDIIEGIKIQDSKQILLLINEIVSSGKDTKRFINQLIEYLRHLMLAKISTDLENMINVSDETLELIEKQAESMPLDLIIRSINILTQVEVDSKWSANSRVILEVGLIRIIQPDLESSIESINERLERLEKRPVQIVKERPNVLQNQAKESLIEEKSAHKHASEEIKKEVFKEEVADEIETAVPVIEVAEVRPVSVEETAEDASESDLALDFDKLEDLWEEVLDQVKQIKISTHALLVDGQFEGLKDHAVCVSYKEGYGFHMIAIEKPENREIVERAILQIYGSPLRIKYITRSADESGQSQDEKDEEKLFDFLGAHKNKLEFQD